MRETSAAGAAVLCRPWAREATMRGVEAYDGGGWYKGRGSASELSAGGGERAARLGVWPAVGVSALRMRLVSAAHFA